MYLGLENVSFAYGTGAKNVLDEISFTLPQGDTLAIVGASGCGKSTLLRIISGILKPSRGDVKINGLLADEYRKRGQLAFMFQEATLMPNLNVRQNIEFPLKIRGGTNPRKVDSLLEIVGLSKYANSLPKELSGGMKTRVSLARSFITEPELLLLDEPFSALDIAWKDALYGELKMLKGKYNTSVIIVTHDIAESVGLSEKIIALGMRGKILKKWDISTQDIRGNFLQAEIEQSIISDHKIKHE